MQNILDNIEQTDRCIYETALSFSDYAKKFPAYCLWKNCTDYRIEHGIDMLCHNACMVCADACTDEKNPLSVREFEKLLADNLAKENIAYDKTLLNGVDRFIEGEKMRKNWKFTIETYPTDEICSCINGGFKDEDVRTLVRIHKNSSDETKGKIEKLFSECNFQLQCIRLEERNYGWFEKNYPAEINKEKEIER